MDLVACVLPAGPLLHLETWHLDEAAAQLTLCLTSVQTLVHCRSCTCTLRINTPGLPTDRQKDKKV